MKPASPLSIALLSGLSRPVLVALLLLLGPGCASHTLRVAVAGRYAYLVNLTRGLQVVDMTNPKSPVQASVHRAQANHVAISGSHVCIATEKGLVILDTSDPRKPSPVGSWMMSGRTTDLAISGQVVYVTKRWEGLRIVDISDPTAPRDIASYKIRGETRAITLAGDHAYLCGDRLLILDVSDPAAPVEAGSWDLRRVDDVAVADRHAFTISDTSPILDTGGGPPSCILTVLDLANVARPRVVAEYHLAGRSGQAIAVAGDVAYVLGRRGFLAIDISDAARPTSLGFWDAPTGIAHDIAVAGSRAHVAAGTGGLRIIDISDATLPREIGSHAD